MKKAFFAILMVAFSIAMYWSYERFNTEAIVTAHPITAIPSDATLIIEANAFSSFWNHFSETNIAWKSLKNDSTFKNANEFLSHFTEQLEEYPNLNNRFNSTPICIGVFGRTSDNIDLLFAFNFSDQALLNDWEDLLLNLNFNENETSFSQGMEVTEWELNGSSYYCTYSNETIHFSTSLSVLQSSLSRSNSTEPINSSLRKVYETASNEQHIKLLVQPNLLAQLAHDFSSKMSKAWILEHAKIGNWTELDFSSNSNAFNFFGFTDVDTTSYLRPIADSEPVYNECFQGIPNYISSFKWWGFSNYQNFLSSNHVSDKTINAIHTMSDLMNIDISEHVNSWIDNQFASFITHSNEMGIVCRSNGSIDPVGKIHDYANVDSAIVNYSGVSIFYLHPEFKPELLFKETAADFRYCFSYDDYVYFTNNVLSCKRIINACAAGQVLINDPGFTEFLSDKFSARSNFMYYCNLPFDKQGLYRFMMPDIIKEIDQKSSAYKGFNRLGWQMAGNENNLVYHNISVSCNTGQNRLVANNDLWEVQLENEITRKPQLLKNHRTNTEEVLVQDSKNNIYIISAAGLVKWKKQIDGPIIGDVKQIDVYGNGKYQMLFNTQNKIHLLDINGNWVRGFPINLPAFASNNLSVFDYQKNHNYRILIGSDEGKIYNFDKTGKLVKGWEFKGASAGIQSEIQRFVIGNKDYICFFDKDGQIYVLDRRGRIRYEVKSGIPSSSGKNRYLVKGRSIGTTKSIYADSSGSIVELLFNGKSTLLRQDSGSHSIRFTPIDLEGDGHQDYLISSNNTLEILGPDLSTQKYLQFNGPAPTHHLFSDNKDYFFSVQNGELNVFNDLGERLPEFPKQSSHPPAISDMNKDGKTDIVFSSGQNVIAKILQ